MVYNLEGCEVELLTSGMFNTGVYYAVWDGAGLSSGVYIVRLTGNTGVKMVKMVLVK